MFGRKERKVPLQRETLAKLENARDDCIALFINSGLTQKQIFEMGGPTPATTSKWLYKETRFPRYETIERFLMALGYENVPVPVAVAQQMREGRKHLDLDVPFITRPRMPRRRTA